MTADRHRQALRVIALLLPAILGILALSWAAESPEVSAREVTDNEPAVVRIYYDNIRQLEDLSAYDVWEVNNLADHYVLAAVDQSGYAALSSAGWRLELDAEATATARLSGARDIFSEGYRTVDELYSDLDTLTAEFPNLTELVNYGQSECLAAGGCVTPGGDALAGYDLRALRITNEAVPGASAIKSGGIEMGTKPVLFVMANIHAREITTPELAMRLADWLLDSYGKDADATWLVDWHEIWIVPTANPDGHWLVELGTAPDYGGSPFYHRKNANQDADGNGQPDCTTWPSWDLSQIGVDLNRNHTFGWGLPGASAQPCDLTYRGPYAGSELEVSNLETLVSSLIPDQRGDELDSPAPDNTQGLFITLHSYSGLVLWPWGGLYEDAPNRDGLKAIGDKLVSFNGYQSCQPTQCLYAASGASDDWAYGELGVPAFTFEIGDEFMPSYDEIDSIQWPGNKPAFIYAARIARTPYRMALGPDSMAAAASVSAGLATVSVTLDELSTGSDVIIAAQFTIDRPFWDEQHVPVSLQAVDGAFDSPVEQANGVISVDGLAPGRHLVYFRGQDSQGNWGAVTAAFLKIDDDNPDAIDSFLPFVVRP